MKESWNKPELTVYGAVEELTQQIDVGGKTTGSADGIKITSVTLSNGSVININPGIDVGS